MVWDRNILARGPWLVCDQKCSRLGGFELVSSPLGISCCHLGPYCLRPVPSEGCQLAPRHQRRGRNRRKQGPKPLKQGTRPLWPRTRFWARQLPKGCKSRAQETTVLIDPRSRPPIAIEPTRRVGSIEKTDTPGSVGPIEPARFDSDQSDRPGGWINRTDPAGRSKNCPRARQRGKQRSRPSFQGASGAVWRGGIDEKAATDGYNCGSPPTTRWAALQHGGETDRRRDRDRGPHDDRCGRGAVVAVGGARWSAGGFWGIPRAGLWSMPHARGDVTARRHTSTRATARDRPSRVVYDFVRPRKV